MQTPTTISQLPASRPSPSAISDLPSSSSDLLSGLRICFLAGTLGQGGAERQLYYMLQCLVGRCAGVSLVTLANGEHWEEPIKRLGVPVYFAGGARFRLTRLVSVFRTVLRLRPEVIQSQHFYTNIYAAIVGRCLGIPSIGAVRNNGISEIEANGAILGRLSLILPRWVAANSLHAIRSLCGRGYAERRFVFLPNAIDSKVFLAGDPAASPRPFTVLGIGRLEPQKRFDRFFDIAVCLQARTDRPIKAVVAGDGAQRATVQQLADRARLKGLEVELAGQVANPLRLFQSSDALLLTSDHEGSPNVVMEAMSCGLPVVATNVGGVSDLVSQGGTGFLFEPGDTAKGVASLERLAREPGLAKAIGSRARVFIEQRHSIDMLPEVLSQLYRGILGAGEGTPSRGAGL